MKKKISILFLILMLIIPSFVMATEADIIRMQEETNRIIESIESQKLSEEANNAFIYAIFIVVAVSMIFENFVRKYKDDIKNKKENEESAKDIRIKLMITYLIHMLLIAILWVICTYVLKITGIYIWFLIIITVYVVEISPLFTIKLKKKKKEE